MDILIDKYKDELYNFCFRLTFNREDADDLFQTTWLKVAKSKTKKHDDYFKAWLFKICANEYKDTYRKSKRKNKIEKRNFESTYAKDYILDTANADISAEQQFEKKYIKGLLVAKIAKLPEKQKLPIVMFYYQRMKYDEIANILGIPLGTVKSRINTAKQKLKTEIEGELYV